MPFKWANEVWPTGGMVILAPRVCDGDIAVARTLVGWAFVLEYLLDEGSPPDKRFLQPKGRLRVERQHAGHERLCRGPIDLRRYRILAHTFPGLLAGVGNR